MVLTSGLVLAVLAGGAGATWASTGGRSTGGSAASRPAGGAPVAPPDDLPVQPGSSADAPAPGPESGDDAPVAISPPIDKNALVEVHGPDGLPTSPVAIKLGGRLVVHLKEQPSTGYTWTVSVPGANVRKTGEQAAPGTTGTLGAQGERVFTIQGMKSGTVRLTFELRRPWESAPAKTVTLTVAVAASEPTVDVYGPDKLPTAPVTVKAGDKLVVHLSEQAGSTGYSWRPTAIPGHVVGLGDRVVPGTGAIGAPGEHTFTYRVVDAKAGALSFALRKGGSQETARQVTVRIAPAAVNRTVDVHGPDQLPATPVQLRVGDTLVVHLSEQAGSTGYSWSARPPTKALKAAGDTTRPGTGLDGAVGEHTFTYKAVYAGTGTLTFSLARPWESAPDRTVTVAVAVQG